MKCDFCGAGKVKIKQIVYNGIASNVCLSCELLDGVVDDNTKREVRK